MSKQRYQKRMATGIYPQAFCTTATSTTFPLHRGAIVYNKFEYPTNHWALHYPTRNDNNFVARFKFGDTFFAVKMNPTDSRGYRCIVALVDKDMSKIINRPYNSDEESGLQLSLAAVKQAYTELGLIPQIEVAGNNSHSFNKETGETILGKSSEPSMLHGHIIGRGNPDVQYIKEVPLRGPVPGELFNMRGNDPQTAGNERKIPYEDGKIELVAQTISEKIKLTFENNLLIRKLGLELNDLR